MGNIFSFELMCCDKITSGCWDCVAGQAIYTYQLEESLSELKTALDELKEQRADVIKKVNIAEQQFDQRIIDGKKEMKNLCMGGCCSMNYRSTLKFSKTVVKRLHDVKVLKRKGALEVVAMEVPAALAVERQCNSSVGKESMLNKVWSILEEKHARIVGIYGVGGVGKTSILTEINNKISVPSNGFDMVIWVVVSKGFRIAKVQDDIAKRIGLFGGMWGEKSAEEKAMDIFRVLREKKFVVQMDDVWERVDVLKVGIPLPTYESRSKIIFTTRSNEVCGQMRAHKKIEVQCLTEEQAWELFEHDVGNDILDGHPNIRECGGLPLALITIGRAMASWRLYAHKWKSFVRAGYELTQVPEVGKSRGIKRMSLMQNKIEALNEPPYCPDLQTLFLNQNQLKVIHNDFFQFMSGLKILCFRANRGIRELPVGISKLVYLEHLDLSYTGIRQLPTELTALEKLKCLKLEGLISGFSKLQMLKMMGSFLFDKSAAKDNNECLVEEMQSLNHLNELSMSVTSAFALERLMSAEMLHTCTEQIGLHSFRDSKQLNILSLANFKCLNYIQISKCESLEEVKTEMDITRAKAPNQTQIPVVEPQMCFQSLVKVYISGCSTLRDITWLILAQNLRHFIVIDCHKMEEIINEIKLSQIAEMYLPELKSIYKDALPFPCMKDIHVYACPKPTRLPLNSDSAKRNKIRIHGKEKWWKEMHWEDESTRNAFLPCFIAEVILHSPLLFFNSLHVCFQKVTFLSFCFVLEKHVDLKQGNHSCSYPLTCLIWLTEDEEPSERTITYCSKSADRERL
ncbi:hypothetical protein GOBAR_DD23619 [Gossypium barbadense]|nr:hypothetical protein GOBAR_DD23619 [Gossypium barbadense]